MKAGWRQRTIGDVVTLRPPKAEARAKLSPTDEVSFVPMECLQIDSMSLELAQTRSLDAVAGSYTYFANGDVLLAKITPCFENGKLGIANGLSNGVGFGSSEFMVLRPSAEVLSQWLYYYLAREDFRVTGASRMAGAVGHKRVPPEYVENCDIPVPPLPEQRRIVALLDEAFDGIAKARANAEKNIENVKALLGGYVEETFRTIGVEETRRTTLGELSELITKGTTPTSVGFAFVDNGPVRFIKVESIAKNGTFIPEKFANITDACHQALKRSQLRIGDILFSIAGALGRVAIVSDDVLPANTNQALAIVRLREDADVSRDYVLAALSTGTALAQVEGLKAGAAQQNLSLAQMRDFRLQIPSPSNQKRIVMQLADMRFFSERSTNLFERKLAALDELKKSLLHHAFAGEL